MTPEDRDAEHYEALFAAIRGDIALICYATALAQFAGVDNSKLNDLFRRHAHSTPADFLQAARIGSACRRLVETKDEVLDMGPKPCHLQNYLAPSVDHRLFLYYLSNGRQLESFCAAAPKHSQGGAW
jgi:AraC-like DNA-binding protein